MVKGWEVVFQGPEYAAQTVAAALDAAGVRVETMTDTGHLWPGGQIDQSRVFVPEEEADRARTLIESEFPKRGGRSS
jgi:hypothetical protein